MKRRFTISIEDLQEGDLIVQNHGQALSVRTVRVEREMPDLPTQTGSVIEAVTSKGTEILARVNIGNRTGPDEQRWVSLSSLEPVSIWRSNDDIQEYTPLVLHKEVIYGDVRDVFYEVSTSDQAPSNALVDALTVLANKGAR